MEFEPTSYVQQQQDAHILARSETFSRGDLMFQVIQGSFGLFQLMTTSIFRKTRDNRFKKKLNPLDV